MRFLGNSLHSWLPAHLHRMMLRGGRRILTSWRRFHYRPAEGCAIIVQNEAGHVLLVRHSYCEPETWMLPAGGMKRKEPPLEAAQREINEEVNCELAESTLLEFEDAEFWGRRYTTFIVGGRSNVVPEADLREIEEAAFFPLSDLPETTSKPTLARLERWRLRASVPLQIPAFVRVDYVHQRLIHQSKS